ncbi:MAG: DNA-binding protein [Pseudomonadota bacterium]|uniref:DNA-binding protein n=1 Tax=Acidovorax sp. Root568 TaxID=1736565 RepID=UPI0006FE61BE|nr:DNA-binding protein [Acidovorax sp. Root568]KRA14193.1 hypothetical protein ASD75_06040 [Acidovorax sp. Root568]
MSEESEIQAEVEALRERFSDTKALYREVCALLFFRYGITPTASKLYQHVRKGSMSAPAEALAKFWEDLRGKARVEIDHPDLPEALKEAAGQAVSVLWTQATELAREELAVLRVEAHAEAQSAQAGLQEALQRSAVLETQIQTAQTKVTELETRAQALAAELEQERRAHAASTARGEALSRQVDELKQEQSKSRQHFSAELDKGRAAIDEAASRAAEAERRALREIDRERTARTQVDKQLEQLRGKFAEVERDHHAKVLEANAAQTRLAADLESARASLTESARVNQLQGVELQQALQAVAQHKAEADTLRALVAQFQPPPRPARKKKPIDGH